MLPWLPLVVLTLAAQPAPGLTVEAAVGFDGSYKVGRWTVVRVDIDNRGAAIDGELAVEWGSRHTRQAVSLASPSRQHVDLLVRGPAGAGPLTVTLSSNGAPLWSRSLTPRALDDETRLTLVVAGVAGDATQAGQQAGEAIASVTPDVLPAAWRAYDAVDRILGIGPSDSRLDAAQLEAIARWRARSAGNEASPEMTASLAGRVTRITLAPASGLLGVLGAYLAALTVILAARRRFVGARAAHGTVVCFALAFALATGLSAVRLHGGSPRSREFAVIEQVDSQHALLVASGRVAVPARSRYQLQGPQPDIWLESAESPDDTPEPARRQDLTGAARLEMAMLAGQIFDFTAEGFVAPLATVQTGREALLWSNVSSSDLRHCLFASGGSIHPLGDLAAGASMSIDTRIGSGPGVPDAERAVGPVERSPLLRRVLDAATGEPILACDIIGGWPVASAGGGPVRAESSAVFVHRLGAPRLGAMR
jgi:hypothetical protein